MFKIAVLGYGRIGKAVTHFLAQLGNKITPYDLNKSCGVECLTDEIADDYFYQYDAIISCLPYHQNQFYAERAICAGTAWLDLGGHVATSSDINDFAKIAACNFVCTDLGLAPGLINIILEKEIQNFDKPTSALISVGGIPVDYDKDDLLNYSLTWSPDGLINEYVDDCEIIKDGKICDVPGLSGCEIVPTKAAYERFHTSGGAAHSIPSMLANGVKDFAYKTIRWQGHCKTVQLLLKYLDKDAVAAIIADECPPKKDKIVLHCMINNNHVYYNEIGGEDGFSAMQTATAKPVVYIAHELLKGEINPGKYVLGYEDYVPVLKKLKWATI